ncbi:hypothetical protein FYK61_18765 [Xanthomonas citri]|nr:hypothetical protein FYK61_18765 [Xanthomonas citri]QQK69394.1 hypothetical protein G3566_18720 [Xanthomonas citri]
MTELAAAGKVTFSRQAQKDFQELGFSSVTATEAIRWIPAGDYRASISYDNLQAFDDYVTWITCPALQQGRRVYVKFRIPTPASVDYLYVTSFHIERVIP